MFGWIGCQASQEIALWGQHAKKNDCKKQINQLIAQREKCQISL